MRLATLIVASFLAVSGPVQAADSDNGVLAGPREARQCAFWASVMSEAIDDPETSATLLQATTYFVGLYEGLTGHGIADQRDDAALVEVAEDMERFSQVCGGHMVGYGNRMSDWGGQLSALGAQQERAGK